jgi:hypothetical protein
MGVMMVVFQTECGRIEFVDFSFPRQQFFRRVSARDENIEECFETHMSMEFSHFAPSGTSVYGLDFS